MKEKSELIYLPSEVMLFDTTMDTGNIKDFVVVDKPVNVLLLEQEHNSYYKILYNGQKWYVRKTDAIRGGQA